MNLKIFALVCIIIFQYNLSGQSGFKGGINLSNYYGSGANSGGSTHDFYNGPNIGYFDDWPINKDSIKEYYYSLGFEISISQKAIIRNYPDPLLGTTDKFIDRHVFLEFPVIFKYIDKISKYSNLKFQTGCAISLYRFTDPTQSTFYDFCGILGIEISYKDLLFNLRYTRGFSPIEVNTYIHTLTFSLGFILVD